MSDSTLVFASDGRNEIVVNFGLFSGRDATPAEIERLAQTLLPGLGTVEIVCEQRYTFDRQMEASIYLVKVILPPETAVTSGDLETVEAWARDCMAERRFLSP